MKRIRIMMGFILVVGAILYLGLWIHEEKQSGNSASVVPPRSEITVYTDVAPDIMNLIASAYEKETQVKVHVLPVPTKQLGVRLSLPEKEQQGDLVITGPSNLQKGIEHGAFSQLSPDLMKTVISPLQGDDRRWIGIWYDPIVFAQHEGFYHGDGRYVNTWFSLAYTGPWRIVLTDFVAHEQATTLLYTLAAIYGEDGAISYFDSLRSKVVQYTKALPSAVRMAAIGDAQIGIGRYSDAKEYEAHRYPIVMLYPREGTPYDMIGAAILKGSINSSESKAFLTWLLSERLFAALHSADIYYLSPTVDMNEQVDRQGNTLSLWTGGVSASREEELLQKWIRQVRFRKDRE